MSPNRLIHESSPYLRQHAHNPVDWYPWGEEAFAVARRENKPILLSIGYSACHWCHVMERESFENEEIARLMNDLFVNVKVDREERPDLDEIYMNAVQLLTGRGGWPMTVFLTPDGQPFFGGTYFPPEDRYGVPGFPRVLRAVAQAYRERPGDVQKSVEQISQALRRLSEVRESDAAFAPDAVENAAGELARLYDPEYGGFGGAPKFPNAGVYELLLRAYARSGERRFLDMVVHTLERMARGGIYDHLGGGFHRYSVDAKWLVPHFEKMLYDNAQLLRIYSEAYRVTRRPLFRQVVEETLAYLFREMRHEEGGFYAAQDADSEGEEGKFFVWTHSEVMEILGEEAGEIFCRIYDVTEEGNFEGKNVLHPVLELEQAAKFFRTDVPSIERLIAEAKAKLFAAREKRARPFRDEKILTSWNGLMVSGLAKAYEAFGVAEALRAAEETASFLLSRVSEGGRLRHTYQDGQAKIAGFLDDYAALAVGLLDLYEASLEARYLAEAERLVELAVGEFWDEIDGGFFSTSRSHGRLIARVKSAFDGSVPSGNALAAGALLRLYHYTARGEFLRRAEKVLRLYYRAMQQQPFGFAHLLCALDFYLSKPREIVLLADRDDPIGRELLRRLRELYLPNRTLRWIGPEAAPADASPLLSGKGRVDGKATVYVCHNFTCSLPATDWDEVRALLGQG
jgi:uncharacterized protein YyaL (SSP411 family)